MESVRYEAEFIIADTPGHTILLKSFVNVQHSLGVNLPTLSFNLNIFITQKWCFIQGVCKSTLK
jgi:hypothetical protein